MKAIFPSQIDGDLLRLVHLSNGFRMIDGAKPLKVGDVCKAEARISSVTNTNEGKIVKVKGHVCRGSQQVIEVESAFLYRGRFSDYEITFEITEEPDYLVEVVDDAAVGILHSKEWFDWHDEDEPFLAGTPLIFRVRSHVSFKDKVSYREASVTSDFFVRDQLKNLVQVGFINFWQDECEGNPVVSYVKCRGTPQGFSTPLANGGDMFATTDAVFSRQRTVLNDLWMFQSHPHQSIHLGFGVPSGYNHACATTRHFVETVIARGHRHRGFT
jgi:fatty acid synthase subunit beta